ncbi:MAG: site-specific DNA-methyltransferase [Rivularia sp. T60_A2020_040]|nr:site-specific DNA-methyltransferase [Rivularia sp. T60_A2020_040]
MTKSLIITYMRRCKEAGIKLYPARFPRGFPEFLIKFLTDENDIVLDPFAGSNTTGFVGESLQRRWISFEINEDYLVESQYKFEDSKP